MTEIDAGEERSGPGESLADLRRRNRELEERLEGLRSELSAAVHELEAYSYSVSHDLRAPLNAIAGFSCLLAEQYHDQLDGQARHYIDRIRAGSQRMAELMTSLLQLSRLSQASLSRAPLDLSALAREVAADLCPDTANRPVEVVIAPALVADADPALARNVLESLIDNACKFSARRPQARIEVGRLEKEQEGKPVFYVRDNGIGLDPAHAERIFSPFQRLNGEAEYPGTGIGLASVKRIVSRHGGRVWCEARPGEGATFYFTF